MSLALHNDILYIVATFLDENEYYDFIKFLKLKMTMQNYFTTYNKYNKKINIDNYLDSLMYEKNQNKDKYLKIVQSLHDTNSKFTEQSIVIASAMGFIEIVKYLHNIRIFSGCFDIDGQQMINANNTNIYLENAIDTACEQGHLNIVKYLYTVGYRPTVNFAFHCACCMGHLDIVDFLYSHGYTWSDDTMYYAIKNNKSNVVKYLCNKGYLITKDVIDMCYEQYNKNILRYFQRFDFCENVLHEMVLESIQQDDLDLFKFLQYDKYNINKYYIKLVLKNKKSKITKYLNKNKNRYV